MTTFSSARSLTNDDLSYYPEYLGHLDWSRSEPPPSQAPTAVGSIVLLSVSLLSLACLGGTEISSASGLLNPAPAPDPFGYVDPMAAGTLFPMTDLGDRDVAFDPFVFAVPLDESLPDVRTDAHTSLDFGFDVDLSDYLIDDWLVTLDGREHGTVDESEAWWVLPAARDDLTPATPVAVPPLLAAPDVGVTMCEYVSLARASPEVDVGDQLWAWVMPGRPMSPCVVSTPIVPREPIPVLTQTMPQWASPVVDLMLRLRIAITSSIDFFRTRASTPTLTSQVVGDEATTGLPPARGSPCPDSPLAF